MNASTKNQISIKSYTKIINCSKKAPFSRTISYKQMGSLWTLVWSTQNHIASTQTSSEILLELRELKGMYFPSSETHATLYF